MTYSIHNTSDWPYEKIKPYGEDITNAMKKIVARFPHDITINSLVENIASGKEQLWLILEDEKRFVAFVTSEIVITETGRKRLLLLELAGEGGQTLAQMIKPIEIWAKDNGIDEICPVGRLGWVKAMKKLGYKAEVVKFTKDI